MRENLGYDMIRDALQTTGELMIVGERLRIQAMEFKTLKLMKLRSKYMLDVKGMTTETA